MARNPEEDLSPKLPQIELKLQTSISDNNQNLFSPQIGSPQNLQETNQFNNYHDPSILKEQKSKRLIKSWPFYIAVFITIASSFIVSTTLVAQYNILSKHIQKVYDWSDSEKTTYYTLITSLPVVIQIPVYYGINTLGNRIAPRKLLIMINIFTICCLIMQCIVNEATLLIFRTLCGVAIAIHQTFPFILLRQVSPAQYKGILSAGANLLSRFGWFVLFSLGFGLPDEDDTDNNYWRFVVLYPCILLITQTTLYLTVVRFNTPSYEYAFNPNKAKEILNKIYIESQANIEYAILEKMSKELVKKNTAKLSFKQLLEKYKIQFMLCCFLAASFQLHGINAIVGYSKTILEDVESDDTATLFTMLTAVSDFVGTFIGLFLVDKLGRKSLSQISTVILIFHWVIFSSFGFAGEEWIWKYVLVSFKFFFGAGVSMVYWQYLPDILPPEGVFLVNIIFVFTSFLTFLLYLPASDLIGYDGVGLFFAGFSVILFILIQIYMKDTRGLTEAQVYELFSKKKVTEEQEFQVVAQNTEQK